MSRSNEYPWIGHAAYTAKADALEALTAAITSSWTPDDGGGAYEQRRRRRVGRLQLKAARLRAKSASEWARSHQVVSGIPLGPSILVGHHSERGHRRTLDRCHRAAEQVARLSRAAEQVAARAAGAAARSAIDSDDPHALDKIGTPHPGDARAARTHEASQR